MAPQFKGVFPRFPKWAVYEMILGFPFHTGHGFFHSIELQSRGMKSPCCRYCCWLLLAVVALFINKYIENYKYVKINM